MLDEAGLHRSLSSFARLLTRPGRISEVLTALAEHVSGALEISGAGVLIARRRDLRLVAITDPAIAAVEEVQCTDGRGPAFAARAARECVGVSDVRSEAGPWPDYARASAAAGLLAVAAVPLHNAHVVGVCDLYSAGPKEWSSGELDLAGVYADLGACYLITRAASERQRRTVDQLERALHSRVVIEQAKGMVAATQHLTVEDAFAVLRTYANNRNETVRAVAEAVVRDGLRP